MILYAAIPPELVFEGFDSYSPHYVEIPFSRGHILVEFTSPARGKIVKLVSNDLQDYLNPRLSPGSIIEFDFPV